MIRSERIGPLTLSWKSTSAETTTKASRTKSVGGERKRETPPGPVPLLAMFGDGDGDISSRRKKAELFASRRVASRRRRSQS